MAQSTQAIGMTTEFMARASINGPMAASMMVIGSIIICTARESTRGSTGASTLASLWRGTEKASASIVGKVAVSTRACG